MAYNPYYPVNYNYGYQQPYYPSVTQPQQPQIQQPVQKVAEQSVVASAVIPVSAKKQAEDYPIAPNAAVVFISTTENVMYLKQSDAVGRPTLQTFQRVDEVTEPDKPTVNYATLSDLETVAGAVQAMRGDIETIRGDLYGLAGKKKTAKKQEVEDDG